MHLQEGSSWRPWPLCEATLATLTVHLCGRVHGQMYRCHQDLRSDFLSTQCRMSQFIQAAPGPACMVLQNNGSIFAGLDMHSF